MPSKSTHLLNEDTLVDGEASPFLLFYWTEKKKNHLIPKYLTKPSTLLKMMC